MEDAPLYRVAFIAEAPAPALTEAQFRQQATARVWASGTQYLADTSVAHRPAHERQGKPVAALTTYTVQVWDVSQSTKTNALGSFCLVAEAETAEACLALLTGQLVELAYDADPSRYIDAQLEAYQNLEAYA